MSGLLQMALIRYYEDLKQRGGTYTGTVQYRGQPTPITIDSPTMREMLIQLVNTVVEFTYMGGSEFHSLSLFGQLDLQRVCLFGLSRTRPAGYGRQPVSYLDAAVRELLPAERDFIAVASAVVRHAGQMAKDMPGPVQCLCRQANLRRYVGQWSRGNVSPAVRHGPPGKLRPTQPFI